MRSHENPANAWRAFTRWLRTGEVGAEINVAIAAPPPSTNARFLENLDEAQQRAVFGAIFAAKRLVVASVATD